MYKFRQFALRNSIGESVSLNGTDTLFASPSGLGYTQQNNMAAIGSGFYKNAKKTFPARNLVGIIVFAGEDPYAQYRNFVNFLNKGYALTMEYTPNGTPFYADVDLEYIQKTELKVGVLECPVSFYAKTPWYQKTPQTVRIVPGGGGNISQFDMTFDFAFVGEATNGSARVETQGHVPASLEILIPGPLADPCITLTDENGGTVGKMELADFEVEEGQILRYSSKYLDTGVWLDDAELIDELNPNNENFFRIPTGGRHTLTITTEGVADINATVYIYNYYRSV